MKVHPPYCLVSQYSFCRFDGRALLDFIRDPDSRRFRVIEKTEEEEELEEFVSFERYRDLIKHRRRGCRYFFWFHDHIKYFKLLTLITTVSDKANLQESSGNLFLSHYHKLVLL